MLKHNHTSAQHVHRFFHFLFPDPYEMESMELYTRCCFHMSEVAYCILYLQEFYLIQPRHGRTTLCSFTLLHLGDTFYEYEVYDLFNSQIV
jgi:hypothetical protein